MSAIDDRAITGIPFLVNERPFCLWGVDLQKDNLRFLNGIDADYFAYLADRFARDLDGDDGQRAALAMRSAYSHGLEAFFSLACAAIQAPDCVAAWLLKYKLKDVVEIVDAVHRNHNGALASRLALPEMSWDGLSMVVHAHVALPDQEKDARVKRGFGLLWSWLASDFLKREVDHEYNSIKHGFRARSGGFQLAIGLEEAPGVRAPASAMKAIGASKHGSSFPVADPVLKNSSNFTLREQSRNWSAPDLGKGLFLIATSISNVVSALKVWQGTPPNEVAFSWPADLDFIGPWARSPGVTSCSFTPHIPESALRIVTDEEVRQSYGAPASSGDVGWVSTAPKEPGWYVARPLGGGKAEAFSIVASHTSGEASIGLAGGGELRLLWEVRYRDRREWKAADVAIEALQWTRGLPASPGWFASRAVGGDGESALWTVYRGPDGRLLATRREGKERAVAVAAAAPGAEWAAIVPARRIKATAVRPSRSTLTRS